MKKRHILYNPLAGRGDCLENARILDTIYDVTEYRDITKIDDYREFFSALGESDEVILCGGDGTLSRFANATADLRIENPLYYFACGNGNDFVRDLGLRSETEPNFLINDYIRHLPSVTFNGETRLFLNNVGFGIDGYCCFEGERLRADRRRCENEKDISYAAIAVRGLLGSYEPRDAIVTVDGISHSYHNVWLAPTLHGKYYGGGMMAAPAQDRLSPDRELSVMVMHGAGKLRTLSLFPGIFSGRHTRHEKYVSIFSGHNIRVEFSSPAILQIDGEYVPDVSVYEARSAKTILSTGVTKK